MRLTATVNDYSPREIVVDTDDPIEALRLLADVYEGWRKTRNPYPWPGGTLTIQFPDREEAA